MPDAFDYEAFRVRELRAELNYDCHSETQQATNMRKQMDMHPQQAAAYDVIAAAITRSTNAMFFLDGPGGTGKSFFFEVLLHFVRGRGEIAVACSWNGLAASLLPGGRTCHSRFGFPVPLPRSDIP